MSKAREIVSTTALLIGSALVFIVFGFISGWAARGDCNMDTEVQVVHDTVIKHRVDTVLKEVTSSGNKIVRVPYYIHDRDTIHDTVNVSLPVERMVYEEDSLYRVVIEGIHPRLIEALVYDRYKEVVRYEIQEQRRWGLGVQAGCGFVLSETPRLAPYIGIGLYYRIW